MSDASVDVVVEPPIAICPRCGMQRHADKMILYEPTRRKVCSRCLSIEERSHKGMKAGKMNGGVLLRICDEVVTVDEVVKKYNYPLTSCQIRGLSKSKGGLTWESIAKFVERRRRRESI